MMLVGLLFNSCRNPAYEINVLFDADVIKYKATLILKDANGATLPNMTVSVSGTDAASIYDFSGTKAIPAPNGIITIGVTPKDVPTTGETLSFIINISGPGYEPKQVPMEIEFEQFSQIVEVTMLKTVVPTPVSTVVVKEIPLNSTTGATTAATTFSTPTSGTVAEKTEITVPAGVTFKDASGKALVGGTLTAQTINFKADDPAAISLFPGGKLSAPNVVDENGNTGPAFFLPAGFTDVQMFVGGVAVKNFSTPISIKIELNPNFVPQSTGVKLAAGNQVSIYSYQTSTGQFKFETVGTVVNVGGKLSVSFQTNHLTVFIVGDVIKTPSCVSPTATISAPWLTGGAKKIVDFEVVNTVDGKVLSTYPIEIGDGAKVVLQGLAPLGITYQIKDYVTHELLGGGAILSPCAGAPLTITVKAPGGIALDFVTLLLNVNCPGKGTIVVPNFDLFYKPVGAPNSDYVLLGTAVKGAFKTTDLKVNSSYDFRANWGSQVKTVNNRTITAADLSVTVGENDFLGDKSPNYNKMLLIEACKGQ